MRLMQCTLQNQDPFEQQEVVSTWHKVWKERINRWQGKVHKASTTMVDVVKFDFETYQRARKFKAGDRMDNQIDGQKPACYLLVKINFDAALFTKNGLNGTGVAIQNHLGRFLARKAMKTGRFSTQRLGELSIAIEGLQFVIKLGHINVEIKRDTLKVFHSINGHEVDRIYNRSILQEIFLFFFFWSGRDLFVSWQL